MGSHNPHARRFVSALYRFSRRRAYRNVSSRLNLCQPFSPRSTAPPVRSECGIRHDEIGARNGDTVKAPSLFVP